MENVKLDGFNIIGITVRTSNNNGQGILDIGGLWQRFIGENILAQIPNKIDNTIYSVYTEYVSDYTQPYTTLIGCRVSSLEKIPDGMRGMQFGSGTYQKFAAIGDLTKNVVANTWYKIWQSDIDRAYTQDFEVYGAEASNPTNAHVDIYIAVKE